MSVIYLNGAFVRAEDARIDPFDRGLTLGDGVFETLRCERGRPVWLEAHLARLRAGAETLAIPLPFSDEEIAAALARLLAASGLDEGSAALRFTLTRGPGPRGLLAPETPRPTVLATAAPLGASPLGPARACVAETRRNERSPLAAIKSLNMLDSVLARAEAARRGCDEALMLNTAGRLSEASSANVFAVIDDQVATPPVGEGALPGIARTRVLRLLAAAGVRAVEAPIALSDLARAREAFLTNSLIGVRPLVAVDGRAVGDGAPGPLTARIRKELAAEIASGAG